MIDPLDPMTLDQTAKRARDGELNSYALYAHEQGVDVTLPSNFHGQKRNAAFFRLLAEEAAAIIERRTLAGLKFYEASILEDLIEKTRYDLEKQEPSDIGLEDGEFFLDLNPALEADPVYLLYRQYNTGAFTDTRFPNGPLDPS